MASLLLAGAVLTVGLLSAPSAHAAPTDLDPTFGTAGIATLSGTLINSTGLMDTAIQPDGKIVSVGAKNTNTGVIDFWVARFNADGSPDPTFDTDGQTTIDIGGSYDYARSLLLLPDGSILVVGNSSVDNGSGGTRSDMSVAKLTPTGQLDTSFDTDGFVTTAVGFGPSFGYTIAAASGGRFVIGGDAIGDSASNIDEDFALVRYNADGSLDTTFSGDGQVVVDIETGIAAEGVRKVIVDGSDRVLAVGEATIGFSVYFAVARFAADGQFDVTFDATGPTPGHTIVPAISDDEFPADLAKDAALQSDGKIVIAGEMIPPNIKKDFAVARVNADGGVDTSFATDGSTTIDVDNDNDFGKAVAIEADGSIVVAGSSLTGISGDWAGSTTRLTPDGDIDTSYGTNGRFVVNPGGYVDEFDSIAIHPDAPNLGKIVFAGHTVTEFAGPAPMLVRITGGPGVVPPPPVIPDPLELDTSFDFDGKSLIDASPEAKDDVVNAVTAQPDGRIVAVGTAVNDPSTQSRRDLLVMRYNVDGSLDTTFDGDGKAFVQVTAGDVNDFEVGTSVAVAPDGKIVIGGYTNYSGSGESLMIVRLNSNGSLDSTFAGDGTLSQPLPNSVDERINGIALQSTGEIVFVGYAIGVDSDQRSLLGRYTASGELDVSFNGNGIVSKNVSSGAVDNLSSVVIAPDGNITAVGTSSQAGNFNAMAIQLDSDGEENGDFSGNGVFRFPVGSGSDSANAVAIDADGLPVIAGSAESGGDTDFFVARLTALGALDTTFSGDGKATAAFDTGNDAANAVIVQDDGKVLAAGYAMYGADRDFALARFNSDGTPDTDFDDDGKGSVPMGSDNDRIFGLTQMPDGRVVAGGQSTPGGLADSALIRIGEPPPFVPPVDPLPEDGPAAGGGAPADAVLPGVPPTATSWSTKITFPRDNRRYKRSKARKISGKVTVSGASIKQVYIGVRKVDKRRCLWLRNTKAQFRKLKIKNRRCTSKRWIKVKTSSKGSWSLKLKRNLVKGKYEVFARVVLSDGSTDTKFKRKSNFTKFTLR